MLSAKPAQVKWPNKMRFLFFGDIVSKPGRDIIAKYLPLIKKDYCIDVVLGNGENVAHGRGITAGTYNELCNLGFEAITLGNHFLNGTQSNSFWESSSKIVRPLNIHPSAAGCGSRVFEHNGIKFRVTNVLGRSFINALSPRNPFDALDEVIASNDVKIHIVDFHAEATGEKLAFAWNYDGKVSCVLGTHTHVQTADARVLPNGTACISDVGMCGPYNGILGVEKDYIIYRTRTGLPTKFEIAKGPAQLSAVVLDIDEDSGKTKSIQTIYINPDREYNVKPI